ncbi:MAG: hypothetical protein A2V64_07375 [Bacteroidetes bacterium RBG_13_43_22]|nr:MAG: hypothetical protein A2V64_07375 [Bacteroidetes bacterium RBG_13_43_22]
MEPLQVKIFTRTSLPRLNYIASIIIGDILGLNWEIVTDKRKFGKHPVINYSAENISGSFRIDPDPLLSETGVNKREIIISEWKSLPVFFQTTPSSDLPFDIFAASFWLVTRYEEYLEFQPDEHGRFTASSSLAYRNGFLGLPVVDLWVKEFARALLKKFPALAFRSNEFKALLTIDIDVPFAYLGRNLFRSIGGLVSDITSGKRNAADRYHVVSKDKKDPYEVFDYIVEKISASGSKAKFFFSVGEHSKFDKNPSWKNEEYRALIGKITERFTAGLHPSYFAATKYALLESELAHLKSIVNREVISGRFHYLRLILPDSYRSLLNAGITEDYSMCYHDEAGFRAGIARPYMFYDIVEDKQTDLRIVPFQVMDVTLSEYKKLDPVASKELIYKLINETRKVGGLFVSLWHNTSLLETPEWQGWREVFESMLHDQQS